MTRGIFILDGPDACGKTTLQQSFVAQYGAIPIHLTWNKELAPRMFEYQVEEMQKAIALSKDNLVIVDRHWISEVLYAKVFRGGSPWPLMGRMIDRVWRKHAAVYIMCLPHKSLLGINAAVDRHEANLDPKHPYPTEKFQELLREYLDFYYQGMFFRDDFINYTIEYEGRDILKFMSKAITRLELLRQSQFDVALNVDDQNFLGHADKSRFVFIGERINKKDNTWEWPFFEYQYASLFFTEVLHEIGFDETHVMFTNALRANGSMNYDIQTLVRQYSLLPIMLGNKAKKICKDMNLKPYKTIMHPSYAMRFNKRDEFKKQLIDVTRLWRSS